jgi:hypothetical protein
MKTKWEQRLSEETGIEEVDVSFEHYRYNFYVYGWEDGPSRYRRKATKFDGEFHFRNPGERGGKTICRIKIPFGPDNAVYEGTANCSLQDSFCYARGREIAFGRAVKLLRQDRLPSS